MSETAPNAQATTIEELAEEVRKARSDAKEAMELAEDAQDRLLDAREELRQKDREIAELEAEVADLEEGQDMLRDRTGLLQTVQSGASMKIDERAAVLIQTLYNRAWKNKQSNANTNPTASMDYKGADGALGGCVNRSTIYRTFEKAEKLVGNEDVLRFIKESQGSSKNTRLVLDLDGGEVPGMVAGQNITTPEAE